MLVDGGRGLPHGGHQRPLHLDAGRRPAGVHDPGVGVAALARQQQVAGGVAVEDGAEADQLVDPGRALVDEHPHRVLVAHPDAGGQRVGQVEVGRVGVAAEHRGHPALGPPGGGLLEVALGQHADPQAVDLRRPHRGGQARHPRTEDQQVERHVAAGVGHGVI